MDTTFSVDLYNDNIAIWDYSGVYTITYTKYSDYLLDIPLRCVECIQENYFCDCNDVVFLKSTIHKQSVNMNIQRIIYDLDRPDFNYTRSSIYYLCCGLKRSKHTM